jgi:hypothetical protein
LMLGLAELRTETEQPVQPAPWSQITRYSSEPAIKSLYEARLSLPLL